jgi:hypothetical protein
LRFSITTEFIIPFTIKVGKETIKSKINPTSRPILCSLGINQNVIPSKKARKDKTESGVT